VFLAYSTSKGHTLLDRALYLPKEWTNDPARCRAAGVPADVAFATKIVLAKRMIDHAVARGIPTRWVTADAVYGSDYTFRNGLEKAGLNYVVGVRSDCAVWVGMRQQRVAKLLTEVTSEVWQRRSCGTGTKGPRLYDWAWQRINCPEPETYARWLLIRRSITDPNEVAYFLCGGPPTTTLDDFVRVAGIRWVVEECFEIGKGDCGLDEYEVRSWTGWLRHVTLSLWALAVLSAIRAKRRSRQGR
jgi:SRSO17 transposase